MNEGSVYELDVVRGEEGGVVTLVKPRIRGIPQPLWTWSGAASMPSWSMTDIILARADGQMPGPMFGGAVMIGNMGLSLHMVTIKPLFTVMIVTIMMFTSSWAIISSSKSHIDSRQHCSL